MIVPARALFYWSMLRQGYWLTEFLSISKILREAPAKYSYSFLYTESDENGMTYFIDFQLRVIRRVIDEFRTYIAEKTAELRKVDKILPQNTNLKTRLNPRQYSLLIHALKHPDFVYKIAEHRRIHGVAYDTARKDLLELADSLGLLQKQISGKSFTFTLPSDLRERIKAAGDMTPVSVDFC